MRDTKAPVKNAMYNARKAFGQPRNKPIKKDNFISPFPIPLFFVIRYKNKKNPAQTVAGRRALKRKGICKKNV